MRDVSLEPVTAVTPRPVRRALLGQRWASVAFLHWPLPPALAGPLMPAGTVPDTFDGVTYVGLIGFRMEGVLKAPYFGRFPETNVRLYSVDSQGRRGVVFLSMEASRLVPVLVARAALGLPYRWSRMRLTREGDHVTYSTRRRWGARAGSDMTIRVGSPVTDPTPLELFLTARWGLHNRAWGRTLHLSNEHRPWPLHRASVESLSDGLVAATGLPAPAGPPVSVLYSPGVAAVFGPTACGR
ncbi:YqjF family protein [Actinoplanes sp. CA-054009]